MNRDKDQCSKPVNLKMTMYRILKSRRIIENQKAVKVRRSEEGSILECLCRLMSSDYLLTLIVVVAPDFMVERQVVVNDSSFTCKAKQHRS